MSGTVNEVTLVLACAVAALVLTGCGDGDGSPAASGETVTIDPGAGPPGCADWAAHPPTVEERAEGCVGENADMYLDAVRAVPWCERWLERSVSPRDVEHGCRAGRVQLAVTADRPCTDGRTLYWNDAIWGFVGEPGHSMARGEEALDAARSACVDP